jgi:hypothetical protein
LSSLDSLPKERVYRWKIQMHSALKNQWNGTERSLNFGAEGSLVTEALFLSTYQ